MDNILDLLFMLNSVIIHVIGLNLFLNKSTISLQRTKIYAIYMVILFCTVKLGYIDMGFCTMYCVVCIANYFFVGKLVEKIWINLFVITTVYIITNADSVFIAKYLYNPNLNETVNEILTRLRILVEAVLVYTSLKHLHIFKNKMPLLEKITTPKGIISSFSCIIIIYIGYLIRALYFKEYYRFENMSYLVYIFLLMICITVIIFAAKQEQKDIYYRWQHQSMTKQLDRQVIYYNKLEEINKQTRSIKHDMQNHMIVIKSLLENNELDKLNEYIAKMTSTVKLIESSVSTGNTIVDAVLNDKLQSAKELGIKIKYKFNLDSTLDLEDVDLCIIFSNTIDNAIEACSKLDEEKRFIKMQAVCDRGYFIYSIKNSANKKVDLESKKNRYTSKKDVQNHGFGINNISNTVKKYNGSYKVTSTTESFLMEIDIPLLNREQLCDR